MRRKDKFIICARCKRVFCFFFHFAPPEHPSSICLVYAVGPVIMFIARN